MTSCLRFVLKYFSKATYKMGENICNHISDKGLVSRIYKEVLQLNHKINKQPDFKMGKGLE